MRGAAIGGEIGRKTWLAWTACLLFLAFHMAASAVPILLGRYPSQELLWALYFDISKPLSVMWLRGDMIAVGEYHAAMVFLTFLVFLLAVEVRYKTVYISVILFSAMWSLSVLVFANYLYRHLLIGPTLETSPGYLKLVVVAVLGYFFYMGLRDLYVRRKALRRQGP
ncbi:MAG: hypothetical protein V3U18_02770 [Alphaproteobacteria bacterium]